MGFFNKKESKINSLFIPSIDIITRSLGFIPSIDIITRSLGLQSDPSIYELQSEKIENFKDELCKSSELISVRENELSKSS